VVCSNSVAVLYHFQDITTSTVYVTACDRDSEKSKLSFDKTDSWNYMSGTISDLCVNMTLRLDVLVEDRLVTDRHTAY